MCLLYLLLNLPITLQRQVAVAMESFNPQRKAADADGSSSPDHGSVADSRDLDDNYQVFESTQDLNASPKEVKRVLRKIDSRIIPVLFGSYMLQYLDKNSLNFASVYGLQEGTNLHGQDYSWLGKLYQKLLF